MAGITVHLKGISGLEAKLRRGGPTAIRAAGRGLYQGAETAMTASKQACPVETGTLRGTGHVDQPVTSATSVSVKLGYGGPAAPYALFVHEGHRIVAWGHDTGRMQPPNKYLEGPLLEQVPQIVATLSEAIGAALESL